MFLGSDNAPAAGMIELETTAAFVAVRMMEGLEEACRALERAGCQGDVVRATERMSGFLQWWNSGSWVGVPLPPARFIEQLELIELLRHAERSAQRLLTVFRNDEVNAAMTDIEAWHGRLARLLLKIEPLAR